MKLPARLLAASCLAALAGTALAVDPPSSGKIDFTRDIRPILSENCYHCHGPDEKTRKDKLRLDSRDGLFSEHKTIFPIKPGNLDDSEAWQRITSTDKDDQMPPPDSNRKLTEAQINKIKLWIEQGAPFKEHWAFSPPKRAELPKLENNWWPKNAVDQFVAANLEAHKLKPSPEAPKEVLLRRVAFDLTGLPPSPADLDAFLADTAPDAYEKVVDRLLASPEYGEHMAQPWLDAVRYADTHGLHFDNERSIWPYRDWVVRAFNQNLPFDQFTIWQIAGDLLPDATRDQQIASGYCRCNVTSSEGGSIDAELLFRYAEDRTETTVANWLGLTGGCAVCHDHKFDPISQRDFYSMFAFFNSAADPAMDGNDLRTPPVLKLTSPEQQQQLEALDGRLNDAHAKMKAELAKVNYADPATLNPAPEIVHKDEVWVDDDFPEGAKAQVAGLPLQWVTEQDGAPIKSGKRAIKRSGDGITQDYFDGIKKPFVVPDKGTIYAWVYLDPQNPPKSVMLQWHSDGNWDHRAVWGDRDLITFGTIDTPSRLHRGELPKAGEWVKLEVNVEDLKLKPGTKIDGLAFTQYGGTTYWDLSGVSYDVNPVADPTQSFRAWLEANQGKTLEDKDASNEVKDILKKVNAKDRTPEQETKVREYYLANVYAGTRPVFEPLLADIKEAKDRKKQVEDSITVSLIMHDLPNRREAHVMVRGQYDKPAELVKAAVPAVFPQLANKDNATRLDLANWLVSPQNPLTSRVYVNRLWQQFFGYGLVKTPGDFGNQGEPPVNQDLLDWLAVEFRESGWDVKHIVKLILTSATYRQDSRVTPELLEADPENRLLARGPRLRLDAEEIRDNALFVSGLIDLTQGGHPVKPYQPEKIWEPVGFVGSNTREYRQDHGAALYRRSLYTFWKRTAPPPSMTTFDAPSRESYCLRRERSDTPLQALELMNDVQQFEAARALGERMISEGGITPDDRIAYGFRLVATRKPRDNERSILKDLYDKELAKYAANPEMAKQAISYGESKPKSAENPSELAAYTLVASTLLNMDETVTKN